MGLPKTVPSPDKLGFTVIDSRDLGGGHLVRLLRSPDGVLHLDFSRPHGESDVDDMLPQNAWVGFSYTDGDRLTTCVGITGLAAEAIFAMLGTHLQT